MTGLLPEGFHDRLPPLADAAALLEARLLGVAVLLPSLDEPVSPELLAQVRALPGVKTAMALKF